MSDYNVGIARLRGVSILTVMLMHYTCFFPLPIKLPETAVMNGYYGVVVFFAVSGFLITTSIKRRYGELKNVSLSEFYLMRAARILPVLGLLLTILIVLNFSSLSQFHLKSPLSLEGTLFSIATLRYNLYYAFHEGSRAFAWAILWSLTIEEVFYLGYPLLIKVTGKALALAPVLAAFVIVGPLVRAGSADLTGLYRYFGCFDAIAMGAIAALAVPGFRRSSVIAMRGLMAFGIALLVYAYLSMDVHAYYVFGPSLIAIGASAVLIASATLQSSARRSSWCDWFAQMGALSYELYLFHMLVFMLAAALWPRVQTPIIVPLYVCLLVVFLISVMINRFYGEPLNNFIRGASRAPSRKPEAGGNACALSPEFSR